MVRLVSLALVGLLSAAPLAAAEPIDGLWTTADRSGQIRVATSSAITTVRPSGLSRSEAILAMSLLDATPTDAPRPVRSRIKRLMSRAISSGERNAPGPSRPHSGC